VTVVPGVLLDHVDVYPAHAHLGVAVGVEERLVQVPSRGGLAGEFSLAQVGGDVLFGVGGVGVVELPVGVSLASLRA
jgi:hypothetical protein